MKKLDQRKMKKNEEKMKINLVIKLKYSNLAANKNAGICGFAPAFFLNNKT
jgi:hypothetical protein